MRKIQDEKLLLSVKEACDLIGVCEKTMRKIMKKYHFEVRIGRRTFVHKKKMENWLDSNTRLMNSR